jgi:hypothetical protein
MLAIRTSGSRSSRSSRFGTFWGLITVGAGIGFTREVDFDLKRQTGPSAPPSSAPGSYSSSGRLAYQAIAGAEVAFDDRWSGFGELRAFAIDSPNLSGSGGKKLRADYQTFDVLVGVSRRF